MAKLPSRRVRRMPVLLALKTELWQSHFGVMGVADKVLLALKTELWQSASLPAAARARVLLALKTELWQSVRDVAGDSEQYCSP